MPKEDIKWLIVLHQGWFTIFIPYYPIALACLVISLCYFGFRLLTQSKLVLK